MSRLTLKSGVIAAAITFSSLAAATDLPSYLMQGLNAMGASVSADGSISLGTIHMIPLMSQNYSASSAPSGAKIGDCALSKDKVSYTCPGGLQFAFMQNALGEMPHFADGFAPMQGYSLPADFTPPAGFVMPMGLALGNGVAIAPLTPADMVAQMTSAGMIARGAVTFNADGTVTAVSNGVSTTYTPSKVPAQDQQGRYMPGMGYGITVGSSGTVTFPDGTTYVPRAGMMTGIMGR